MWWAGTEPVDVFLGSRSVALGQGAMLLQLAGVTDVDAAMTWLSAALEELPAPVWLRVWLSGSLCRPFIAPPIPGLKSRAERLRAVRTLAPGQTGLVSPCVAWMDEAPVSSPCVAVAVEASLFERVLRSVAKPHRLLSVRPWWRAVLEHALVRQPELSALAVFDGESLTLLAGTGATVDLANTLTPITERGAARSALTRQLLATDIDPQRVAFVNLELQTASATEAESGLPFGAYAQWSS